MPVYKGSAEVTSGNLHKGSAEIQDGYKGSNSFFLNQTTVAWASPVAVITNMTLGAVNPASSSGLPGTTFPSTNFSIASSIANTRLSGTATIGNLPSGLTYSQSINFAGPGNTITITITGVFPATSYSSLLLTITGITDQTYTSSGLTFTGPSGGAWTGSDPGPYVFNWNGIGKGYIEWNGYYPSNPPGRTDFHDLIQMSISNQGSGADWQNINNGIYGPATAASNGTKTNPLTDIYYGVSGTTNGGSGASSNSGSFFPGSVIAQLWPGSVQLSFSVLQDDTNFYFSETKYITTTLT